MLQGRQWLTRQLQLHLVLDVLAGFFGDLSNLIAEELVLPQFMI